SKANPGKLSYGASSILTGLIIRGLIQELGLDANFIPYPSDAPRDQDLLTGQLHLGVVAPAQLVSFGDNFRVLAVSGDGRDPARPDVPTLSELKLGRYLTNSAFSLNLPAGVPTAIADKLAGTAVQVLRDENVKAQFAKIGMEVTNESAEVTAKRVADQAQALA